MDWRQKSEELFFKEHLSIKKIAEIIGKSRQHISRHINKNKEKYQAEREKRKKETKERQREKRREYDKKRKCSIDYSVTAETMKREHETAVRILSHEKYYK